MASLIVAFLQDRVWKQKDLERRCGVSGRAVRARILDLQSAGIPIEREEDHPHVYYSVRAGWFPERGTGVENLDHVHVARLLSRLPRGAARDRILSRLVATAFGSPALPNPIPSDVDDNVLEVLEDSIKRRIPIQMGYFTASRGEAGLRAVSVQRVLYGSPTRFIGYCHRSCKLKMFRADRVTRPGLDASATFLEAGVAEVESFVAGSLDGFVGPGPLIECSFRVRERESRWVQRNLPPGALATVDQEPNGIRLTMRTAAPEVLARYLTGLGAIVRDIEPTTLRARVGTIAREALAGSRTRLNKQPARAIRSAG